MKKKMGNQVITTPKQARFNFFIWFLLVFVPMLPLSDWQTIVEDTHRKDNLSYGSDPGSLSPVKPPAPFVCKAPNAQAYGEEADRKIPVPEYSGHPLDVKARCCWWSKDVHCEYIPSAGQDSILQRSLWSGFLKFYPRDADWFRLLRVILSARSAIQFPGVLFPPGFDTVPGWDSVRSFHSQHG